MNPLQPAGAALESLEAAGRHVALLVAEIERLRTPYFEAWALLYDGEITPHPEESGIGMVNGYKFTALESASADLYECMKELEISPPVGACGVNFRVADLSWNEGQMSFPETGQWDFPPHWEMNIEVIGYDIAAAISKELT